MGKPEKEGDARRRPRKLGETQELAKTFIEKYRGKKWGWDDPECRRALGEAKRLINPSTDPVTGEPTEGLKKDYILRALEEMQKRNIQLFSLHQVLWKVPKEYSERGVSWYEMVAGPSPAPPLYDRIALRQWYMRNKEYLSAERKAELATHLEVGSY